MSTDDVGNDPDRGANGGATSPQLVWRGQTMSDRALDRRNRLLRAGYELLGTEGAAGTTVRAVSRRAEIGSKYFYENFADSDELMTVVHTQVFDGLRATVANVSAVGTQQERIRAVFDTAAAFFEEDPRRARIFFREAIENETLLAHVTPQVPLFVLATAHQLGILFDTSRVDETNLAITVSGLSGSFVMIFLDWLEERIPVTREQVVSHCTKLVLDSQLIGPDPLLSLGPPAPAVNDAPVTE